MKLIILNKREIELLDKVLSYELDIDNDFIKSDYNNEEDIEDAKNDIKDIKKILKKLK